MIHILKEEGTDIIQYRFKNSHSFKYDDRILAFAMDYVKECGEIFYWNTICYWTVGQMLWEKVSVWSLWHFVNLIPVVRTVADFESQSDKEYKFTMVYRDLLTKSVVFKALISKRANNYATTKINVLFGSLFK